MTTERNPFAAPSLLFIVFVLVGIAVAPTMVKALPPRPTPLPTPEPTPTPAPPPPEPQPERVTGATVALSLSFPSDWPWETTGWQDLWTAIQWQHPDGTWHEVEGWQGTLDHVSVAAGEDGSIVVGRKAWWVGKDDLGDGPFRWVIARERDGAELAVSDAFSLPVEPRQTRTVEVVLTP